MGRRRRKKGQVIGLKVTKSHPLDSHKPEALASYLAQYLQAVINHTNDSQVYAKRANIERQKAIDLRDLAKQVEARHSGARPKKISRMDPLDSYDPGALSTQASQHERNAAKFEGDAKNYSAKAVKEQTGIEISKRDVAIPETIKEMGTHKINVKLHPEVIADLKLDIEKVEE